MKKTSTEAPASTGGAAAKGQAIAFTSVPVPTGHAPKAPKGFEPPAGGIKGAIVTPAQERAAPDMAREVSTSKSYVEDFTKRAPDPQVLAAQLNVAKAWTDEMANAEAWLAYAKTQHGLAWKEALTTAKKLKPEFELADKHDPSIGDEQYPQTRAFLHAWKDAALRGAETRAINRKKKKKDAPPTPDK